MSQGHDREFAPRQSVPNREDREKLTANVRYKESVQPAWLFDDPLVHLRQEKRLPLPTYLERTVERLKSHVSAAAEFKKRLAYVSNQKPEPEVTVSTDSHPKPVVCEMRAGLDQINWLLNRLEKGLLEANEELELP